MWGEIAGAAIGAIGSLIGGARQQAGAEEANRQQIALAREQMAFQERMSNTAYQRSMQDMRAAGLNPILAYQKGGASTPGGSMPTIQNEQAGWGNAIGQAATSAQGAFRTAADYKVAMEEVEKKKEETSFTKSNTELNKTLDAKAKQDTMTSASQMLLNNNAAANQHESAVNAAVQNQILRHQVNSAFSESQIKQREAEDAQKYGHSVPGATAATIERASKSILDRLLGHQRWGGGGTSETGIPATPTSPRPRD